MLGRLVSDWDRWKEKRRVAARRPLALAVFFASLVAGSPAHAEPRARLLYLRAKGAESCPSESEVRQAVQVRLGYDPFSTYAASTMLAEVAPAKGGFIANLRFVDPERAVRGDRVLKVQGNCADLMDAMALTISIAVDPMSVTRDGPPPDAAPLERPVDAALPTLTTDSSGLDGESPPALPAEPSRRSTGPVFSAALGPLVSLGTAPSLSTGGVLTLDARFGGLVGGVEGRADLPSSAHAGELGRVVSSLITASLLAGWREGAFSACAVGSVGRLSATSSDVAAEREASALVVAAGFRVGIAVPLSERIEARARAELLANLTRHTLEISERRAFEYPVASGNVSAALAVRFR
jgi:hypothetical protein